MGESSAVRESQLIGKIALILGIVALFIGGYAALQARANASDLVELNEKRAGSVIKAPKTK